MLHYVPLNGILLCELTLCKLYFIIKYRFRYFENIRVYTIKPNLIGMIEVILFIDVINLVSIQDANYLAVYPKPS